MANVNNLHGLRPLMRAMGGGPTACRPAHKLVGDGTALFINDAVLLAANGTKNNDCITAGSAGGLLAGVNLVYGALSTATDHLYIPTDSEQMFETQIDTAAVANANACAALVAGAGSATTKISGHSANGVATTNTLALRIVGLWQSADNAWGAYARVIVICNKSQRFNQQAGV
jgi:hypothetical protein